jgi:hypothetical protein
MSKIDKNKIKIDVITYCAGYNFEIFDRFVGSLNDTGFSGNIHIIINSSDKPTIKLLKKKYTNVFPIVDNLNKFTHINCHRFFCIQKLLHNISFNCDYMLICDSRDVMFQKNIELYNFDSNVDIYGFLEGIKFNQEMTFNTPWIKMLEQLLNEKIYDKIYNLNIICCGTTICKKDVMVKYVDFMCDIISKYNIKTNLDQGIHNYMLYLNKLNVNVKLLSNEDNLVNTVCNDIHKLDDNNNIVNVNNDVSYIVHQYDRFSLEYKQRISSKYNYTL